MSVIFGVAGNVFCAVGRTTASLFDPRQVFTTLTYVLTVQPRYRGTLRVMTL